MADSGPPHSDARGARALARHEAKEAGGKRPTSATGGILPEGQDEAKTKAADEAVAAAAKVKADEEKAAAVVQARAEAKAAADKARKAKAAKAKAKAAAAKAKADAKAIVDQQSKLLAEAVARLNALDASRETRVTTIVDSDDEDDETVAVHLESASKAKSTVIVDDVDSSGNVVGGVPPSTSSTGIKPISGGVTEVGSEGPLPQQNIVFTSMEQSMTQAHERINANAINMQQMAERNVLFQQQMLAQMSGINAALAHFGKGVSIQGRAQETIPPLTSGGVNAHRGIIPVGSSNAGAILEERLLSGPTGRAMIVPSEVEKILAGGGPKSQQATGEHLTIANHDITSRPNQGVTVEQYGGSSDSKTLTRVQNELFKLVTVAGKPADDAAGRRDALARMKSAVYGGTGKGKFPYIDLLNTSKQTLTKAYIAIAAQNKIHRPAKEAMDFIFVNILCHGAVPDAPLKMTNAVSDDLFILYGLAISNMLNQDARGLVRSLRQGTGIEVRTGSDLEFKTNERTITTARKKAAKRFPYVKCMSTFNTNMSITSRAITHNVRQLLAIQASSPKHGDLYNERIAHLEKLNRAVLDYMQDIEGIDQSQSTEIALMFHLAHGMLLQQTNCFYTGVIPALLALAQVWAKNGPPAALIKGLPKDPNFKSKKNVPPKRDPKPKADKSKFKCAFQCALGRCPREDCDLDHDCEKTPQKLNGPQKRYLKNALKRTSLKDDHADIRDALATAEQQ